MTSFVLHRATWLSLGRKTRTNALRAYASTLKEYHLSGHGHKSQVFMETDDGFLLRTDTPRRLGGNHTNPQPVQMFLASLCGCEQATAHFVARKLKIQLDRIEFSIRAYRNEAGSAYLPITERPESLARLQSIEGSALVHTTASQAEVDQLASIVKERCPLANMVTLSGCELNVEWKKA